MLSGNAWSFLHSYLSLKVLILDTSSVCSYGKGVILNFWLFFLSQTGQRNSCGCKCSLTRKEFSNTPRKLKILMLRNCFTSFAPPNTCLLLHLCISNDELLIQLHAYMWTLDYKRMPWVWLCWMMLAQDGLLQIKHNQLCLKSELRRKAVGYLASNFEQLLNRFFW